jgi:hypothetical protein
MRAPRNMVLLMAEVKACCADRPRSRAARDVETLLFATELISLTVFTGEA